VNQAEATLVKQADLQPCGSLNIGTISKLAQNTYEEGHRVGWDEARILEIESNNTYWKYKESAHMACLTNLISQPSLNISPIWIPLISTHQLTEKISMM
jgi:hypothetical protein